MGGSSPTARSYEDRLRDLEKSGAFGFADNTQLKLKADANRQAALTNLQSRIDAGQFTGVAADSEKGIAGQSAEDQISVERRRIEDQYKSELDQANSGMLERSMKDLAAEKLRGTGFENQGLGYLSTSAQNALSTLQGNQPSVAQLGFQQNLQNSIAAQQAAAQGGQVDAALAYRIAAEQADQQRQQALINSAMLRASEISQARTELGQYGQAIGGAGAGIVARSVDQERMIRNQLGQLEADAAGKQFQAEQAAADNSNFWRNAITGAAAQAGSAAVGAYVGKKTTPAGQ